MGKLVDYIEHLEERIAKLNQTIYFAKKCRRRIDNELETLNTLNKELDYVTSIHQFITDTKEIPDRQEVEDKKPEIYDELPKEKEIVFFNIKTGQMEKRIIFV